jgi:hypothetical protein
MSANIQSENQSLLLENSEVVDQIVKAIRSVRFGQVQIIIQDSRVVQIDTTEKLRLA